MMINSTKISIIVCLLCFSLFAQDKDSTLVRLEKAVALAQNDTSRVEPLIQLGGYQLMHDFGEAEQSLLQALEIIGANPSFNTKTKLLPNLYGQLGVMYKRKGDYPVAIENYLLSLDGYEQLKDSSNIANIYHNMAMVHRDQRDYHRAISLFKKTIVLKSAIKDTLGEGIAYNMIGVVHRKKKELDSAMHYYKKAKEIFINAHSESNIYRTNGNIAALYYYKKEYAKARDIHLDNIVYYTRKNRKTSLFTENFNLSKIYLMLKNYELAIRHSDIALKIAEEEGMKERLSRAYLRKSYIYSQVGDYKAAYMNHQQHKLHSDSVFNKTNVRKIQELELTYKFKQEKLADSLKFAKKKRELELVTGAEKSKKQLYFALFLITIFTGIIIGYLLRMRYKDRADMVKMALSKKQEELNAVTNRLLSNAKEYETLVEELKKLQDIHGEVDVADNLRELTTSKILTKEDWLDFKQKFSSVYPNFLMGIRNKGYQITESEERLIALEKLNLNNNDISTILGIAAKSVIVTRYRLRKKLNIPSEMSLVDFLEESRLEKVR